LKSENKKFDPVKCKHAIEKYFEETSKPNNGTISQVYNPQGSTARKVFSKDFYDKLKNLGKSVLEKMGLHEEITVIDNFFLTNNRTQTMLIGTTREPTQRDTIGNYENDGIMTPGGLSKSKSSIVYVPSIDLKLILSFQKSKQHTSKTPTTSSI
jgi:hypothetical protein